MNTDELMLFYINMGNREWQSVINSKPPGEIKPEDFAHSEFCSAVVRCMIVKSLIRNLSSEYSGNRYWAGLRLYAYWSIEKLLWNNN